MRKPFKIGNREFKYKKNALTHYKNILNSYSFGETLNENDFNDLLDLLKYDFTFKNRGNEKFEQNIYDAIDCSKVTSIKVNKVQFNTKCFEIIFNDLSKKNISYSYIINRPKTTPESTFKIACRNVVHEDINLVKRKYFQTYSVNGLVKCQETNQLSKWEDLVVDHRQPNTFSIIIDRFRETSKINLEKIEYLVNNNNQLLFKSEKLSKEFRNYHKEKANLRIVRKECNLSRTGLSKINRNSKDLSIE